MSKDAARRRVCVCVDDYGLHAGIDRAARHLVDLQRVHAVSCLVGGASWHVSSQSLRLLDPKRIDVGLHLDFTEAPKLSGSRHTLGCLIIRSHLQQLDRARIRAEIRAQFDAFEQAMGRAPAYVDGHQHVHQLPIVRSELLDELASRVRSEAPPWIRSTRAPRCAPGVVTPFRERFKAAVIQQLGSHRLAVEAQRRGYPQNRHLLGVYDFRGGASRYRQLLAAWLRCASDGDLLMCHPGWSATDPDPLAAARRAEFDVLSSAALDAEARAAGVELGALSAWQARRG